jgi:hypothetical protein
MSDWKDIKEEIYFIVDGMTVAGGYNYDWQAERRLDKYTGENKLCKFTLRYPEDSPFEDDITGEDDRFLADSMSQVLERECEFVLMPVSDMGVVKPKNIIDLNNDALDKALRDIRKAVSINTLSVCGLGVLGVEYGPAIKEETAGGSVYYPFVCNLNMKIIYSDSRSL